MVNLTIKNATIDLLALRNVSELLASGNVSPGNYTQIRIVVENATGVMVNGTLVNFTVPSGELKSTHPFNVIAGATENLTFEMDLHIVDTGHGWQLTPVIGSVQG